MGKRSFLGGIVHNEKGSVLIITVGIIMLFSVLFALMTEVGLILIAREEAQTANDAAALASATSEIKKWVRIDVITTNRQYWTTCCDEDGCWPCCQSLPDYTEYDIVGLEKDLIDNQGWRQYRNPGDCGGIAHYEIKERWVKYDTNAKTGITDTAAAFFNANLPARADKSIINKVKVYNDINSPYYPSVVIYTTTTIKSLFPSILGKESYEVITCSQGKTYYEDPASSKMSKPPQDACWVDW